jgi:hypothetical protein
MTVRRIRLAVWSTCVLLACGRPGTERGDASDSVPDSAHVATRCYRSPQSVLLGPIVTKSRSNGQGPGWIRIEGFPAADSGAGKLIDANRAGLGAWWRRESGDSVSMAAFDDFLRVDLRLTVSDTAVLGEALARSDADVEPDSAGTLRDIRREWMFRAVRASCDSMPLRWDAKS